MTKERLGAREELDAKIELRSHKTNRSVSVTIFSSIRISCDGFYYTGHVSNPVAKITAAQTTKYQPTYNATDNKNVYRKDIISPFFLFQNGTTSLLCQQIT